MSTKSAWPAECRVKVYKSSLGFWLWEVGLDDQDPGWPVQYGYARQFSEAVRMGCCVHAELFTGMQP